MLTSEQADLAARRFIDARRNATPVAELPAEYRPRSFDDAYLIQDAFVRRCGQKTIGYKIGCASLQSQALAGSDRPIAGRLFAESRYASPARLEFGDYFLVGMEAEFGFVMGATLAAGPRPVGRAEVAAAVAAVVPLIEICDTRLADWKGAGIASITADNAFHGAVVLGQPQSAWRELDLATHEATLAVDGTIVGRGTGALVLGHPLDALDWIANFLVARGGALKAGDLVAAGTCTGLHFVHGNARVVADFGSLDRVEIQMCEPERSSSLIDKN